MNGEELRRRLDGRTITWLARELGVSRENVSMWANDGKKIPAERARQIRERLPLPGDDGEVPGGEG